MGRLKNSSRLSSPSFISLIIAEPAASDDLQQLLQLIPLNYNGAILVTATGDTQAATELKTALQNSVDITIKEVNRSISLDRGKTFWLNEGLDYTITAGEQLKLTPSNVSEEPPLVSSLRTAYPHQSQIILLSTQITQFGLVPLSQQPSLPLLSLVKFESAFTDPLYPLSSRFSIRLYDTLNDLGKAFGQVDNSNKGVLKRLNLSDREAFSRIIESLRLHTDLDLFSYKQKHLIGQIENRRLRLKLSTLQEYASRIEADVHELDHLRRALSIGVTSFFRDTSSFLALHECLHRYLASRDRSTLKIWSAGCSNGSEPYSLAMLCDRLRESDFPDLNAHIVATDISSDAIEAAQRGLFSAKQLQTIPSEYLPTGVSGFDASNASQERTALQAYLTTPVTFAVQDLLQTSPQESFDLIVCRNLFIYLTVEAQERLLMQFHQSLNVGGLMMLGRSESAETGSDYFVALSQTERIYRALQLSSSD